MNRLDAYATGAVRPRVWLLAAVLCLLAGASDLRAQSAADIVFSEIERRLILEYFGHPPKGAPGAKGVPPGLAKKGGLPPGLAKQGKLPPGIAKKALPADLLRRLPAARPGTERVIVDNDVVLIAAATGVILDVLFGAAKRR